MDTFQNMDLPRDLLSTLDRIHFNKPTPIQSEAIPHALLGRDILGSAQTGTGKTGAFGIPLVAALMLNSKNIALVLTPTRELATQVMSQLHSILGYKSHIKSALLIGGDSIAKQLVQLRNKPRIIVGTPGRINDHLRRLPKMLCNADFLVLDETDRMLDMGFAIQIESIIKCMAQERQTLLFSATLPKNIIRITEKYLVNPVRISVNTTSKPATNIHQETLRIQDVDKYPLLISQLQNRSGSIIIFVKTKYGAERMAVRLMKDGYEANAIHGNLKQNKRDRVIKSFRNKKYRVLVATDIAARGLDIPHIEHVINYDLPQCAEDYIHRIGRTARAGAKGEAVNFVTPLDEVKWRAIEVLLNPGAKRDIKSPQDRPTRESRRYLGKRKMRPMPLYKRKKLYHSSVNKVNK